MKKLIMIAFVLGLFANLYVRLYFWWTGLDYLFI
jgi:hypothetical protein